MSLLISVSWFISVDIKIQVSTQLVRKPRDLTQIHVESFRHIDEALTREHLDILQCVQVE